MLNQFLLGRGDVCVPARRGLCFGKARGDAPLISWSGERLALGSDTDGPQNPREGSASCKAKLHRFQGTSHYSPCQHLSARGKSYSEIHHEFSWHFAFLFIRRLITHTDVAG